MAAGNGTGSGDPRRWGLEALNNVTIALVVISMALAWCYSFLFGPPDKVDGTMYERVFIFVLGVAFGAQAVKKGVEQGTTAALTPVPPPGTTTTTTTEVKPIPEVKP